MKNVDWQIKTLILSSILMWCWLPSAGAVVDIDVEMRLNDGGFISYDHFKAELYMNNLGGMTPGATIFGILEVLGEFFFWPSFSEDVDFEIHDIHPDESHILFLEFDFENIDEFVPFGPMVFWGAWFLDMNAWNYDFQEFWLDSAHKWTPTPMPTDTPIPPTPTPMPTDTPINPTSTPMPTDTPVDPTSTPMPTDTPIPPTPTPMPTDTPIPPTSTPMPTDTPIDPTSTPMPTDTPIDPTSTPMPTDTPIDPTSTPTTTPTLTPTPIPAPGDLVATDPIVGNMRFVPAGTFTQGSPGMEPCRWEEEGPQFTHILTKSIVVMETEVSRQMWANLQAVQGTLPDDPSIQAISPGPNYPVQSNTWYESVLFANLLSLQNGFTRCYYTDAGYTIPVTASNYTTEPIYCNFDAEGYRLPTGGEWEYFTRAGTSGPFSCDEPYYNFSNCDSSTPGTHQTLENYCVYCVNSSDRTAVVGSKLPNPWNLNDVHGNVHEWCWDWYAAYPTETVTDYVGPDSGSSRVYRGGGWYGGARYCRSASRYGNSPSYASSILGLRVVRTVSS